MGRLVRLVGLQTRTDPPRIVADIIWRFLFRLRRFKAQDESVHFFGGKKGETAF